MSYPEPIESYDVHIYWIDSSASQKKEVAQLQELIKKEFAEELKNGDIVLKNKWDKPVGPHPITMFEVDFQKPELFVRIVPFFTLNHGSLLVLIHPQTGNEYLDHTKYALWLGHKIRLNLDMFKQ